MAKRKTKMRKKPFMVLFGLILVIGLFLYIVGQNKKDVKAVLVGVPKNFDENKLNYNYSVFEN